MGRAPRLRRAVDPRCPAIGLRGRGSSLQDNVRRAPMNANAVAREGLRLISRLAGAVVAVPMITGYVTLGAAVAIGRSLLDTEIGRASCRERVETQGVDESACDETVA